jgi:4'-phosphopantetheinyl transferase
MTAEGDCIHLYMCRLHWVDDAALLARCLDLLDAEERERHARYRFERDARLFAVSHALVRTALSDFAGAGIDPASWRFETNEYGKPEVVSIEGAPRMRFSLTHTHGFAACAVTSSVDIGVDAEAINRNTDVTALAPRILSPSEQIRFQLAAPDMRRSHFLSLWTLKEAFVKACGLGLNMPVEQLSFFMNQGAIKFGCTPAIKSEPRDWAFTLMQPTAEHCLSLAIRAGSGTTSSAVIPRWFVPLAGDRAGEAMPKAIASTRLSHGVSDAIS